jgi:uncharacterized SAM-binding protein YcdF (DUF218 family)
MLPLDTVPVTLSGRAARQNALVKPLIMLLLVLVVAWVAVGSWLFIVHHGDKPFKADAVVVLAGTKQRLPVGLDLMRRGFAPVLVVSRGRPASPLQVSTCRNRRYRVICFDAHPFSTHGEAEEIGRLARAHHWTRLNVVTSSFHVFRARILIKRCYGGELRMIGAPQSKRHLPLDVVKESVKLAYQETAQRRC